MALGLKTESSGADIIPRIQYDARAGRFFRIDRTQDAGGNWHSDTEEMPLPVTIAIDLDNIEVGWISFAGGQPDFQMVPLGEPLPARPTPEHKQGFRVKVYTKALGLRHWNHTAKCVLAAVDALHDQYMSEKGKHSGQVPVVTCARTIPIVSGSGTQRSTNYQPVFEITKWIPRPDEMKAGQEASDEVPFEQAPKPSGAQHVPPPAQPASAAGTDTDF